MFEDISNPLKGKGKEKDVGKRRAYVRVVTNLGGGSLNLELFCEKVLRVPCHSLLHPSDFLHQSGAENMLQLFDAGSSWEI
jgi:hypothetical protein